MPHIEHFALFAEDLDGLRRFYEEEFGLKVVLDNSKAPTRGYFLADPRGCVIELIERPAGTEVGSTRFLCHVALWVDDYDATRERLASQGFVFESDSAIDTPDFRTLFFNDPAGNRCQIVWRSKPLVP
jgi:catechol 2,3-dioxygenase-like lactoylglutathione lyase family enzyme